MQTEQFVVQNVKCGGCTSAIESGLAEMPGVSAVKATIDGGTVTVSGESLDRAALAARLAELGYPEA